jgi:hypothetical protein
MKNNRDAPIRGNQFDHHNSEKELLSVELQANERYSLRLKAQGKLALLSVFGVVAFICLLLMPIVYPQMAGFLSSGTESSHQQR